MTEVILRSHVRYTEIDPHVLRTPVLLCKVTPVIILHGFVSPKNDS